MISKVYIMKKGISVVIFAHNDQGRLETCIKSVSSLTKNIHLLDIGSTDKTSIKAEQLGATVHKTNLVQYVELVREEGIRLTDTEWVLILDADESLTQELIIEIKETIDRTRQINAFRIPRKNMFAGKKWLKHGGWWPDYQIRLIYRDSFVNWPKQIHSTPNIKGGIENLKNPILHNFHGDFENMVNKTLVFEEIESDLLYKAEKKANTLIFIKKFLGEFYRRLFKHAGFIDGPVGIIEIIYQSFSKTITYLFLYEKKKNRSIRSIS